MLNYKSIFSAEIIKSKEQIKPYNSYKTEYEQNFQNKTQGVRARS